MLAGPGRTRPRGSASSRSGSAPSRAAQRGHLRPGRAPRRRSGRAGRASAGRSAIRSRTWPTGAGAGAVTVGELAVEAEVDVQGELAARSGAAGACRTPRCRAGVRPVSRAAPGGEAALRAGDRDPVARRTARGGGRRGGGSYVPLARSGNGSQRRRSAVRGGTAVRPRTRASMSDRFRPERIRPEGKRCIRGVRGGGWSGRFPGGCAARRQCERVWP